MAGYSSAGAGAVPFVDQKIAQRKVMLFTKKWSKESEEIKKLLDSYRLDGKHYEFCEIESRQDCTQIENYFQILCQTNLRVVPHLFVGKRYIGSRKEILEAHESGKLRRMMAVVNVYPKTAEA